MKRSKMVLLSIVAVVLASPLFGQHADPSLVKPPPPPPPFVEASVPDGKALIYIYRPADPWKKYNPIVLSRSGPVAILKEGRIRYVTDAGVVKLWIVSMTSGEIKIDAVAGQIYYIKGGFEAGFSGADTNLFGGNITRVFTKDGPAAAGSS